MLDDGRQEDFGVEEEAHDSESSLVERRSPLRSPPHKKCLREFRGASLASVGKRERPQAQVTLSSSRKRNASSPSDSTATCNGAFSVFDETSQAVSEIMKWKAAIVECVAINCSSVVKSQDSACEYLTCDVSTKPDRSMWEKGSPRQKQLPAFDSIISNHDHRRHVTGRVCRQVWYIYENPAEDVLTLQDVHGRLLVRQLQRNGKAARAGVKIGDELVKIQIGDSLSSSVQFGINALLDLVPPVMLLFMCFVGYYPGTVKLPPPAGIFGMFDSTRELAGESSFALCDQVVFHEIGAPIFLTLPEETITDLVLSDIDAHLDDPFLLEDIAPITSVQQQEDDERLKRSPQMTRGRLYELGKGDAEKVLRRAMSEVSNGDERVYHNAFCRRRGHSAPNDKTLLLKAKMESIARQKLQEQDGTFHISDAGILANKSLPQQHSESHTKASSGSATPCCSSVCWYTQRIGRHAPRCLSPPGDLALNVKRGPMRRASRRHG